MPLQRIAIKPSAVLAIALCLAHMAAAGAIWFAALPSWVTHVLLTALGAGLAWSLVRQVALRRPGAIVALEIAESGRISVLTRSGTWHASGLLGTSYVSPRLTILNLTAAQSRLVWHVVLLPDNVDAQDFRRLRTWLRWAPKTDWRSDDVRRPFGDVQIGRALTCLRNRAGTIPEAGTAAAIPSLSHHWRRIMENEQDRKQQQPGGKQNSGQQSSQQQQGGDKQERSQQGNRQQGSGGQQGGSQQQQGGTGQKGQQGYDQERDRPGRNRNDQESDEERGKGTQR